MKKNFKIEQIQLQLIIQQLDLEEIAFIASLPKAPNNYNPKTKYSEAIERRNWVLERMYKNNFISFNDLQYKISSLVVEERYENKFEEANYFKEEVRKQLNKLLGNKNLYSQGYIVKTTT